MKPLFRVALFSVLTAALTVASIAQSKESKDEQFNKIAKMSQTKKAEDQKKAYEMGKEFIAQYGKDNDDKVKKIKDYVEKYRLNEFNKAVDEVRVADAAAFGKEILAAEPDNAYITLNLAYVGYEAYTKKQDKSFAADAANYAKQTISSFESGKAPKVLKPFKDQAEATALMYYAIGTFALDSDIKEAAKNFYKATQFESQIKKNSYPHYVLAYYYEKAYEAGAKDFQAKHASKTSEDAQMKADREKLDKIVDRMIDAYARAVKLAETENNPAKEGWKTRLTEIYKYRKQSDAGLNELLASVLNTPLPDPATL